MLYICTLESIFQGEKMKRVEFLFILFCCTVLFSCVNMETKKAAITVTIQPQKYFAEKIAGGRFEINCIVPEGSSPETYDPSPSLLVKAAKSEAYFKIGYIGFEIAWLDKLIQNTPGLQVFDNSIGVEFCTDTIPVDSTEVASSHIHFSGINPHIWCSPRQAVIIIENMYKAFVALDPKHQSEYEENYKNLLAEVSQVDSIFTERLAPLKGKAFVVFHPSLSYLARDYGLEQISLESDGKEPSAKHFKEMVDLARRKQAKVFFVQKEFDRKNIEVFAREFDGKIIEINPLNYNWIDEQLAMINILSSEYAD